MRRPSTVETAPRDRGHPRRVAPIVAAVLAGVLLGEEARGAPAREAIAVIVHPKNRTVDLSRSRLASLFLRKQRTWAGNAPVLVVNAPPRSPLRRAFDRAALSFSANEVAAYWIDFRIRGHGRPPPSVGSSSLVVRLVARQQSAVAYVPVSALAASGGLRVKVLRIDGKRPTDPRYPLVLGRDRR